MGKKAMTHWRRQIFGGLLGKVWLIMCGYLALVTVSANIAGKLKVALVRHGIFPEVMMTTPKLGIYVAFGKSASARFGNRLELSEIQSRPTTIKWKTDHNQFYTLIAMDLDYIDQHPVRLERQLLVAVNIPADGNFTQGLTLAPYVPPKPHETTLHRILFLVFEEPKGKANFTETPLDDNPDNPKREGFDVHNFTESYGLGEPVAANFFITAKYPIPTEPPLKIKKKVRGRGRPRKNATTEKPESREVEDSEVEKFEPGVLGTKKPKKGKK